MEIPRQITTALVVGLTALVAAAYYMTEPPASPNTWTRRKAVSRLGDRPGSDLNDNEEDGYGDEDDDESSVERRFDEYLKSRSVGAASARDSSFRVYRKPEPLPRSLSLVRR